MTERFSTKHGNSSCIFGPWHGASLLHRSDSNYWKYASSHAHSGFDLRLCLRLAVGAFSRPDCSHSAQHDSWNASYDARSSCYGI